MNEQVGCDLSDARDEEDDLLGHEGVRVPHASEQLRRWLTTAQLACA